MIITAFLCISRHDHITNDELMARSGQMSPHDAVAIRRIRFIGHILRLQTTAPASLALERRPKDGRSLEEGWKTKQNMARHTERLGDRDSVVTWRSSFVFSSTKVCHTANPVLIGLFGWTDMTRKSALVRWPPRPQEPSPVVIVAVKVTLICTIQRVAAVVSIYFT